MDIEKYQTNAALFESALDDLHTPQLPTFEPVIKRALLNYKQAGMFMEAQELLYNYMVLKHYLNN